VKSFGDVDVPRGEVAFGSLGAVYRPDGSQCHIPIIVVHGAEDGPILWLGSAMHGPEITGTEVIRRLCRETLDPRTLKGAVVAAPIMNPFAYNAHVMNTPHDGYNLNRVFPGGDSQLSFRLAKLIWEEGAGKADYIIDYHANPDPAIMFSLVKEGSGDVEARSSAMARAYGITIINMRRSLETHRSGSLTDLAVQSGVPSITIELVRWRRMDEVAVASGLRGTLNVMVNLGMVDGRIEPQDQCQVIKGRLTRCEVTASRGGLVHPLKDAGGVVRKDEPIALVRDAYGDVVETVISPVDGYILAYPFLGNQTVGTGDFVAFIAFHI